MRKLTLLALLASGCAQAQATTGTPPPNSALDKWCCYSAVTTLGTPHPVDVNFHRYPSGDINGTVMDNPGPGHAIFYNGTIQYSTVQMLFNMNASGHVEVYQTNNALVDLGPCARTCANYAE